jgi:JmjC domain, hydroxylase
MGEPLARWTFFAPHVAVAANDLLRADFGDGWMFEHRRLLSLQDSMLAKQRVEEAHGAGSVLILEQYAGTMVSIPPGWPHSVENLQPSLKYAWELVLTRNVPLYLANHASLYSRWHDNAAEYLPYSLLVERALKLDRELRFGDSVL